MSSIKEFVHTDRGYVLMGDSRDIAVSYSHRQALYDWASENKITIEYQGTLDGTDLWRVREEQHRSWFVLKWS
jgi:hypothetical protein